MGVYDQTKSAFQDIIVPELHARRSHAHRDDNETHAREQDNAGRKG